MCLAFRGLVPLAVYSGRANARASARETRELTTDCDRNETQEAVPWTNGSEHAGDSNFALSRFPLRGEISIALGLARPQVLSIASRHVIIADRFSRVCSEASATRDRSLREGLNNRRAQRRAQQMTGCPSITRLSFASIASIDSDRSDVAAQIGGSPRARYTVASWQK